MMIIHDHRSRGMSSWALEGRGKGGQCAHFFENRKNVPFYQTKEPFLDYKICSNLDKDAR